MKTKLKIILTAAIVAIGLSGCATKTTEPYALGGSRADATVEVGYDFSAYLKEPDESTTMQRLASQKCQAWGYDKAEAFGGQRKVCLTDSCFEGQVVVQYQCLGSPE